MGFFLAAVIPAFAGLSPTAVLSPAPPDSDRPLSFIYSAIMLLMACITDAPVSAPIPAAVLASTGESAIWKFGALLELIPSKISKTLGTKLLLRGTILNRTYGAYKNLYISLFLLVLLGPIYYVPP